jgi:DNA polymerase elongation subunit (family B)
MELFTWSRTGERIRKTFKYNPYLYIETGQNDADGKSIFGSNLKKKTFQTEFDRRSYVKETKLNRIFGNLPPVQQFLIDVFWKYVKREEFSMFPLKIWFLDIEVYSPNEFPDEAYANHPINLISIYDNLSDTYHVWGLHNDYNIGDDHKDKKIVYKFFETEQELLLDFIAFWKLDYPDIVTAWNLPFDNNYICNRIKKLFGEEKLKELSPVGRVYLKHRKTKTQGREREIDDYFICGISLIDYLEAYDKFNFNPVPNLKLDTIGEIELGVSKIDYEQENLAQLADQDWNQFVDYNIRDVEIIKGIEAKTNYLEVCRMLGYMGLTLFENGIVTVPIVNGYAAVNAYERGLIIPTFPEKTDWGKYEGAYVKDPLPGVYKNIVSYDLNSLYPNTMITLNISPETKFGKIYKRDDNFVYIIDTNNKEYKLTHENFKTWIKQEKLALSKADVLFSQKKKGIFSEMVEEVYNDRVKNKKQIKENKKKLSELDKNLNKEEIKKLKDHNVKLDILQYTRKIFINSVYGYCGNRYAPMADIDAARSITLTCQHVIQTSEKIVNKIINNKFNTKNKDYAVYEDTDSIYISLMNNELEISSNDTQNFIKNLEVKLNAGIKKWGELELNSIDSRFEFKRESICDYGMFLKKKHYVLHMIDDEGFACDKWKYKGVKLVSASMPKELKPGVKSVVQDLILNQDETRANQKYMGLYNQFNSLNLDSICKISGVSNFTKYHCNGLNTEKGMPYQCKSAYYYNLILDKLNLQNKYTKIKNGDKIKLLYLDENNKFGIKMIAYLNNYPEEFEQIFNVDKRLMFEKGVMDVLEPFYSTLNFTIRKPNMQIKTDIYELFG